jgi:hypothetical protein
MPTPMIPAPMSAITSPGAKAMPTPPIIPNMPPIKYAFLLPMVWTIVGIKGARRKMTPVFTKVIQINKLAFDSTSRA